jgi:ABC-type amino acid transport substrate-binding protein
VIVFRNEDAALRDAVNRALSDMKRTGELKSIYQHYGLLDRHQIQLGIQ